MAGVTAHGAQFTFRPSSLGIQSFSASAVGISVETPTAEVVDMTGATDPTGYIVKVPTGDWSGGSVAVDFLYANYDPSGLVRVPGTLVFTSPGMTISRRVILESASVNATAGDLVKGSLRFSLTDYQGQ